jgi:2'-5' RNA ligase
VALLVPAPLDAEVDGLRRALGDSALGRIPAHVTLVPPVNVREEDLGLASATLAAAAAGTRPFVAVLGPGATFFPDSPVVYLALSGGAGEVEGLRGRVLAGPLARPIRRPFVPHVTVCDEAPPALVDPAVAALAAYRVEVRFEAVHLLEEGEGRRWLPIADYPFRGRAVVGRGGLPLSLSVSERPDPEGVAWLTPVWEGYVRDELGGERPVDRPLTVTARREGSVVGLAQGRVAGTAFVLERLVVAAAHRSQGIGGHLLAATCSAAADRGCLVAWALVPAASRALSFLEGRGFVARGSVAGWWDGRDAQALARALSPAPLTDREPGAGSGSSRG